MGAYPLKGLNLCLSSTTTLSPRAVAGRKPWWPCQPDLISLCISHVHLRGDPQTPEETLDVMQYCHLRHQYVLLHPEPLWPTRPTALLASMLLQLRPLTLQNNSTPLLSSQPPKLFTPKPPWPDKHGKTRVRPEISLSTTQRDSHPEPKTETETPNHHVDEALGAGTVEQDSEDGAPSKKPLTFKLAFVGLAAAVCVFQIDATSLGIAHPMSSLGLLSPSSTCLLSRLLFLLAFYCFVSSCCFLVALVPYFFLSGRNLLGP